MIFQQTMESSYLKVDQIKKPGPSPSPLVSEVACHLSRRDMWMDGLLCPFQAYKLRADKAFQLPWGCPPLTAVSSDGGKDFQACC